MSYYRDDTFPPVTGPLGWLRVEPQPLVRALCLYVSATNPADAESHASPVTS